MLPFPADIFTEPDVSPNDLANDRGSSALRYPRKSLVRRQRRYSNSSLSRNVDRQVFNSRLLDWLGIELHQLHYLVRHSDLDGEA
jgi:hypothetical protein